MPLAGSKLLGTTILYVGPTTDTYSTGMCYTCKATESNSYYWEKVQTNSDIIGHNIFDIFYSMSSEAPAGAMDLSLGTLIASCDTVFPDFWIECVARKAAGSIRTLTEDEWQAEATANGSCGAFVVDEDAKSVRLPKITNMIQPGDIGVFTEAGLPNITGTATQRAVLRDTTGGFIPLISKSDGVFATQSTDYTANTLSCSLHSTLHPTPSQLIIDASMANSIYGNSTTVQPPAVGAKLYIQVFTSVVPASMAQAGEFINMLETKADKAELESYLSLSGGTITGGILSDVEATINGSDSSRSITINGGNGWGSGGSVAVYGTDHTTRAGQVILRAWDGINDKRLEMHPDGTLTWCDTDIITEAGTGLAKDANTLSLATVVTAGNAGPTANASPGYGGTFTVPYITYDAYGRVTGRTNRTITMPVAGGGANAYVTASWQSGKNWYRVWSNGRIEQGGYKAVTAGTATTISFHKAFTTTNVTVIQTPCSSGGSSGYEGNIDSLTKSNFVITSWKTAIYWYATGY